MSWKLRAPRRERNRTAVGRPDRRDVERLGDGHALLPRAIVVRHVDVRDAAVAHRTADAVAVAIRRERDLGAGDAVQSALLLVHFVGDGVGVGAHRVGLNAGGAAAVLPRHRRRAARDVDQPHADQDALGCLGDAADQHGVGVELLPAVQRPPGRARPAAGSTGTYPAESCSTPSRTPDRPRSPRRRSSPPPASPHRWSAR